MKRKHTPLHDKWHRRVEGQIRDCIMSHPEWFCFRDDFDRRAMINSLAKRVVGEIVADVGLATSGAGVGSYCPRTEGSDGGLEMPSRGEGVTDIASSPFPPANYWPRHNYVAIRHDFRPTPFLALTDNGMFQSLDGKAWEPMIKPFRVEGSEHD